MINTGSLRASKRNNMAIEARGYGDTGFRCAINTSTVAINPTNCSNPNYYADGYCDSANNVADCGWDGGDCCESTCFDATYTCGQASYDCLDPNG